MIGRPTHKQVRVRIPGKSSMVDQKIAPLIRQIWRLGISTFFSCQDVGDGLRRKRQKGWAYIGFFTSGDAFRFVNACHQADPATPGWCRKPSKWRYEVFHCDVDELDPHGVRVYFPASQIEALVKELRSL